MATFGNTGVGASTGNATSGNLRGSKFTLSENGDITKISVYLVTTSGENAKVGIFKDVGGSPADLEFESSPQVLVEGWNHFTVSVSLSAGDYWLCFETQTSGNIDYKYDAGTSWYEIHVWNGWPDPAGGTVAGNREYSIYATYTPSAAVEGSLGHGRSTNIDNRLIYFKTLEH